MHFDLMSKTFRRSGLGLAAFVFCGAALADDVTGSDSLLCYALSASRCEVGGTCEQKYAWELNLPDFVKLDLKAKQATTTKASGDPRETQIRTLERGKDGTILLQGIQGQRAFSWLITESTGEGTLTMSSKLAGITVFTVCTPIDKL
jgi:hypothetical protein